MVMVAAARARVDEWEAVHQQVPWGEVPDRNFEKFVRQRWGADWTRELNPVSFLDLGCGAGAQAIWLADNGYIVMAVDGSFAALDRLLERVGRHEHVGEIAPRIRTKRVDLTQPLEFSDSHFECVFDVCCLQHLAEDDAVAVTQKARRWLRPGGWFWSKQAIAPFDSSLNRVSYIRLATIESIRRTFIGYSVEMDMAREIVRGDKTLWSVIIRAQVKV